MFVKFIKLSLVSFLNIFSKKIVIETSLKLNYAVIFIKLLGMILYNLLFNSFEVPNY